MIKVIQFLPSLNYTSGVANMIMNYYSKIDKNKVQFYFIYFCEDHNKNFKNEIKELGGDYYKISSPVNYFAFRKQLDNAINNIVNTGDKSSKIIFHNHQIYFMVLMNAIVKKYTKNIIVHNHLTKYSDKFFSKIRNYILCIPIKYMNLNYFACSKEASKIIFGKKNKVEIINNGIEIHKFLFDEKERKKIRKKLNINEKSIVIGNVGRLEPQKNQKFLLDVFKSLNKDLNNTVLLIIGKGYLKEKFQKYVQEYDLISNVIFLEDRNDINKLLSAMDIFVLPSKFEGLGIVAIEAQANGLPVIISNKVPSEVNIINTKIVDLKSNIDEWVNQIKELISLNVNRIESNDIMKNTYFNIDFNVKNLEEKYQEIVSKE